LLITGSGGWTGRYLARHALSNGATVYGFSRTSQNVPGVRALVGDIRRDEDVDSAVRHARPDLVIHLAALMPGVPDWSDANCVTTNVNGTLNLLTAVHRHAVRARVLIASSSAVYGRTTEPVLNENATPQPVTVYAAAKLMAERIATQHALEHNLQVIRVRPFNQTGPGEPDRLVCSAIARQIASIEMARAPLAVKVRTLSTARDFTDVRDVAIAYWDALTKGSVGEVYNICSGVATPIRTVTNILMSLCRTPGLSVTETTPEPFDIEFQVGDASKLSSATSWRPTVPLETSLHDLLNDWRARAAQATQ
jgi:GDP-4-dehydro-6-deoxy-D-mannose reductase